MANMLDYLVWRGDLSLEQAGIGPVDALILSELSYLHFDRLVPEEPGEAPAIRELSQAFLELPEDVQKKRVRSTKDLELLELLGRSGRFGPLRITAAREQSDESREIQFAAIAVLLGKGDAFTAFRGTDNTLVGWKEDFNLSFLDTILGQWAARDYLEKIAERCPGTLYAGGHSKGGNLAVFAAAVCSPEVQARIRSVYNNDGPGFSGAVLEQPGYQAVLGRIQTFVPQSSVVGMLLEHEEPYTVVRSGQVGLMQHEPYSWEVLGSDFVRLKQVTQGSRLVDQTIKTWLSELSRQEREAFVEALFELLENADIRHLSEAAKPKNLYTILQKLGREDDKTRLMIARVLSRLVWAAAQTLWEDAEE